MNEPQKMCDIIGDPQVFIEHMTKDAMMISEKDKLPVLRSYNQDEYIKEWEERNNKRCKIISIGQDGDQQNHQKSSEMKSSSDSMPSAKKQMMKTEKDAS